MESHAFGDALTDGWFAFDSNQLESGLDESEAQVKQEKCRSDRVDGRCSYGRVGSDLDVIEDMRCSLIVVVVRTSVLILNETERYDWLMSGKWAQYQRQNQYREWVLNQKRRTTFTSNAGLRRLWWMCAGMSCMSCLGANTGSQEHCSSVRSTHWHSLVGSFAEQWEPSKAVERRDANRRLLPDSQIYTHFIRNNFVWVK